MVIYSIDLSCWITPAWNIIFKTMELNDCAGGGEGGEVVSTRFDSIRFVRSFVFDVEQCLFIQDRNSRVTGVHITRRRRVNENSGERFTNLPSKLIDAQVESNSGCLLIASICGGGNDDSITTRIVTEGLEERAKKGEGWKETRTDRPTRRVSFGGYR